RRELGVSAATIRNEMADLEELGLLLQPHTSAGRIPSEDAYRLYVESLMSFEGDIDKELIDRIDLELFNNINQISELIESSIGFLSGLTNYTALGITQSGRRSKKIKDISITLINPITVVVVTILDDGSTKTHKFNLFEPTTEDAIDVVKSTIIDSLKGLTFDEISSDLIYLIKTKVTQCTKILDDLMEVIEEDINSTQSFNVLLNGVANIFDFPEFNDIGKAKLFFNTLAKEEELLQLLEGKGIQKGNINIIIGDETMEGIMKDCSIIMANYYHKDDLLGKIGIIGPKRMDYQNLCSIISYVQQRINDILNDS
ncbi:MAG: heat-inducible transcriptional repressor HrcA, partial [Filifactoraceae bacterium]